MVRRLNAYYFAAATFAANIPRAAFNAWRKTGYGRLMEIVAQQRSGHHAIINWIRANLSTPSVFLNTCSHIKNPLEKHQTATLFDPAIMNEVNLSEIQLLERGFCADKLLIYNFEEKKLLTIRLMHNVINRTAWLGPASRFDRILVIRDPYNLMASKLRWHRGCNVKPSIEALYGARDMWIRYAEAYLRSLRSGAYLGIDYNTWFTSNESRETYAERLGLASSDKGLDRVARYGPTTWGDSFDGMSYDKNAQQMNTLRRWETYADDQLFRDLVMYDPLRKRAAAIYSGMPEIVEALDTFS